MSKPTHFASTLHTSSFEPVLEWTYTVWPHSGTPERFGLMPMSFSRGVMLLLRAHMDVWFLTQIVKWRASAQSVFGKPE